MEQFFFKEEKGKNYFGKFLLVERYPLTRWKELLRGGEGKAKNLLVENIDGEKGTKSRRKDNFRWDSNKNEFSWIIDKDYLF